MINGLFLHNPLDLNSKIPGGVQICSQEFLKILRSTVNELHYFEVDYSKSIAFRLLYKLNLDNYISYDIDKYANALLATISKKQITHVFINKSELIRFSKVIKADFNNVKVVVMSHGNESGDFLGDLTGVKARFKGFKKYTGLLKLGLVLFTESFYRKRYVDLVCTMSEEESALEKWLGLNCPFYIPRLINKTIQIERAPIKNVFGYVGTLNHTPNITALEELFGELKKLEVAPEIRVVGQPKNIGKSLANQYPFVKYLGSLNDTELLEEVKNWSFFINPIFNYSRGASMKLAKAIEWEIPIITTIAGRRGYLISNGLLIETDDTPQAFATSIINLMTQPQKEYQKLVENVIEVKNSSVSADQLGVQLKNVLTNLGY
jgi:glycosyltransferase involved in cell wall biosynthesis